MITLKIDAKTFLIVAMSCLVVSLSAYSLLIWGNLESSKDVLKAFIVYLNGASITNSAWAMFTTWRGNFEEKK